jgi:membrane-associated phospholipid phosphatase
VPLLVLVLIALAAGLAAALIAGRYPGASSGRGDPALDVAREAGRYAGRWSGRLDPEKATGLALTLALAAVFAGGLLLAGLTAVVRSSHGAIGIDSSAADWGDRHATGLSTDGLQVVTALGETWVAVVVGVVVALIEIARTRSRWLVPFLLAVVVGDKLLTTAIKELVDRVRPDLNPIAETLGPSFPSGHSSTSAALWAAVALVVGRWYGPRVRPVLAGLAVGIAVGVAASRVLLDVHWLTDVIGGLALGWAWFAACAVAFGGRLLRFGAGAQAAAGAADARARAA